MTNRSDIRTQGIVFSAAAWLCVLLGLLLPRASPHAELLVLSFAILVLGVPHGALDIVFGQQIWHIRSRSGWVVFLAFYVALAACVVALWLLAPSIFLTTFLLASVFHFSGDPEGETPATVRALYGGLVIVLPALFHMQEVAALFAHLVDVEAAAKLSNGLRVLAVPWLVATLLAAGLRARKNQLASLEMISVAALALWAPPLVAFTVFFCGMHGARHILRTRKYAVNGAFKNLSWVALGPMLATVAGLLIGWQFLQTTSVDARVVQLLFVMLAALTVPHMLLVDGLRFTVQGAYGKGA
ncbi:MAG: Brp/Blh family beta-carotene 15,15'-dioxygenase [Polaromonas sp.]|nr:Brp/Blh family beta-carotene 15,15'-dioxygenase [Polaromonas sp.]